MTDDMITLRELMEKGSDATLLREMIGFAAQRLMELETENWCGAGHGERSEESDQPAQRLPGSRLADTCWDRGAAHTEATPRQLLSRCVSARHRDPPSASKSDPIRSAISPCFSMGYALWGRVTIQSR